MVPLRVVLSKVMVRLKPLYAAVDHETSERWLIEALMAASIKQASLITIRLRDGVIEGLIHDCGSDDCASRMRPLTLEHLQPLLEAIQYRTSYPAAIDLTVLRRGYGQFTQIFQGVSVTASVYAKRTPLGPQINLLLRYEPS